MIGKRKRDAAVISRTSTTADAEDAQSATTPDVEAPHDIFRKFFESQFQPLELPAKRMQKDTAGSSGDDDDDADSEDEELGSQSEWNGVSDEDEGSENNKVEVVECKDSRTTTDDVVDKKARKAFMVCLTQPDTVAHVCDDDERFRSNTLRLAEFKTTVFLCRLGGC